MRDVNHAGMFGNDVADDWLHVHVSLDECVDGAVGIDWHAGQAVAGASLDAQLRGAVLLQSEMDNEAIGAGGDALSSDIQTGLVDGEGEMVAVPLLGQSNGIVYGGVV